MLNRRNAGPSTSSLPFGSDDRSSSRSPYILKGGVFAGGAKMRLSLPELANTCGFSEPAVPA